MIIWRGIFNACYCKSRQYQNAKMPETARHKRFQALWGYGAYGHCIKDGMNIDIFCLVIIDGIRR